MAQLDDTAPEHGQVGVLEWVWDGLALGSNVVAVAADTESSAVVHSERCAGERMSLLAQGDACSRALVRLGLL